MSALATMWNLIIALLVNRIYGSPVAYTLNNAFYGWLGGSYKFDHTTSGGVMFNYSQKVVTTGSAHSEVIVFAGHKLENHWKAARLCVEGLHQQRPRLGCRRKHHLPVLSATGSHADMG